MEHTVVTPDGVPLHVVSGDGPGRPVVLLHGGGRSVGDWADVAERLTALGHRPVAVDLRGHGATPAAPWSWDAALADVAAVVDALGLERPAVVGHSLGGMIAALWAAGHPECPLAVDLDGHGNPTRSDQFAGPDPGDGAALLEVLAVMAAGLEPHLRAIMAAIDALDLFDVYARARCPLLVTRGDVSMAALLPDQVQGAWVAYERWLAEQLAQAAACSAVLELAVTPTAHDPHLEAPELVASLVDRWLAR